MSIFDRFLPKKRQPEVKNTIPQEKTNIKKTFGVYCHKHHNTSGDKLCPKCTALLATVMVLPSQSATVARLCASALSRTRNL